MVETIQKESAATKAAAGIVSIQAHTMRPAILHFTAEQSAGGALDQIPDTLEGGQMLTHYAEGSLENGLLFACSCLFRVNSITLVVTVPAYAQYGLSLDAIQYYRKLLADRSMKHSLHLTQFHGESFEISKPPLDVRHVTSDMLGSIV